MELEELKKISFNDFISLSASRFKSNLGYFYILLSAYTEIVENNNIPTACAAYNLKTKKFKINMNKDFLQHDIVFTQNILLHELFHIIMGHHTRPIIVEYNKKSQKITNLILDAQINGIIEDIYGEKKNVALSDRFLQSGVKFSNFEEIAKENYVDWSFSSDNLYNPIESIIEDLKWLYELPNETFDDFMTSYIETEELAELIESEVRTLLENVKGKYKSENLQKYDRVIAGLSKPKKTLQLPTLTAGFKEIEKISEYSTYTQYNYMTEFHNYIKKQYIKKTLPKAILAVDVSGSISPDDMTILINNARKINAEVDLIFWSCGEIVEENVYKKIKDNKYSKISPISNGGTDLRGLYEYIEKNYKNTILCLISDFEVGCEKIPDNVVGLMMMHYSDVDMDEKELLRYKQEKLKYFKYRRIIEWK